MDSGSSNGSRHQSLTPLSIIFTIMELFLKRTYFPNGTNGELIFLNRRICYTIELAMKNNLPQVSCIPEGRYRIARRYSSKFKNHLWLLNVPGRSLILIHPANNAVKQLRGCIAPVTTLTGIGTGSSSKPALERLMAYINHFGKGEQVYLTIENRT